MSGARVYERVVRLDLPAGGKIRLWIKVDSLEDQGFVRPIRALRELIKVGNLLNMTAAQLAEWIANNGCGSVSGSISAVEVTHAAGDGVVVYNDWP